MLTILLYFVVLPSWYFVAWFKVHFPITQSSLQLLSSEGRPWAILCASFSWPRFTMSWWRCRGSNNRNWDPGSARVG